MDVGLNMHLQGGPGGGLGGRGLLRRASIIVRPFSQSRPPREVADTRRFLCPCPKVGPREAADKRQFSCGRRVSPARNAACMQSATNAPTGNLKLNRKTAGQPFSYSSFKFSCPCGNPQVEASTSLGGDTPSHAGVLGHVETMLGSAGEGLSPLPT